MGSVSRKGVSHPDGVDYLGRVATSGNPNPTFSIAETLPATSRSQPLPAFVAARRRPSPPVAARGRSVQNGNVFWKKLGSDLVVQSSR